ncbi:MAG: hypothetical protein LLF89_03130 [Spirochaetaceae bacterium]|nr:hypothetical protein [Spirochaetaceae bacterium]
MQYLNGKVYHAAGGFLGQLLEEVPDHTRVDGDLVSRWTSSEPGSVYWTRNVWEKPFLLEFDSISQAAKALKAIQRNWAACPTRLYRRVALIEEALPGISAKARAFPFVIPAAPMGAFTLLDEHLLLGSAECSSKFPNGELSFIEDKGGPPSRAYLKLWEALELAGRMPCPGECCLDAGASPGGWTWVLSNLGAKVISIDRAPLDPAIATRANVSYMSHDAFTLKPEDIGPVDWLFSDVICYPPALLAWIEKWLESGLAKNFICTIKMQGEHFDKATTDRLASIPDSRVVHLWHNKHELTWMRLARS